MLSGGKMGRSQDDFLDELKVRIRKMTPQTRVYHVLRDELSERGYWQRLPRGNPKLGYRRMQEIKKQRKALGTTPEEA
jgi:hypothetical protein